MLMEAFVWVFVWFICSVRAVELGGFVNNPMADCGPCDRESCPSVLNCAGGLVLDKCGCCSVCAKQEFEICEHPQAPSSIGSYRGKCDEHLDCKLREDLEPEDEPEAVCVCTKKGTLCGSDDVTYSSLCQLSAATFRTKSKITVKSQGPCQKSPVIVSGPENAKDYEGSNVAIVCEATGYPIPSIEWTWTRVDGKTVFLPSDDLHVSVNMRGGPEKFQVTGWLQVMEMTKEHEGDYTCIAQNEHGVEQASARINVLNDPSKPGKRKGINSVF